MPFKNHNGPRQPWRPRIARWLSLTALALYIYCLLALVSAFGFAAQDGVLLSLVHWDKSLATDGPWRWLPLERALLVQGMFLPLVSAMLAGVAAAFRPHPRALAVAVVSLMSLFLFSWLFFWLIA